MYELRLSCGKEYIGQTGRCLNDCLREYSSNVKNYRDGHLSVHCHVCGCQAQRCEIFEAPAINRSGQSCVSAPFMNLLDKAMASLESSV